MCLRLREFPNQYPSRTRKGNSPRAAASPPITLKMLRLRPHSPSANEGSQSPDSEEDFEAAFVDVIIEVVVAVVVVEVVVLEEDEDSFFQPHLGSQYPQCPLPPMWVRFSWVRVEHHSLPFGSVTEVQVLYGGKRS